MSLLDTICRWLGKSQKRTDFASRLDAALAHETISIRVEAWERSLPSTSHDLEPHTYGVNK